MRRLLVLLCVMTIACAPADDESAAPAAQDTAAAAPAAPPATGAPGDAQIAHIVRMANGLEIQSSLFARQKGQHADVKAFGETMIGDHTKSSQQLEALETKHGIARQDNATSQQMNTEYRSVTAGQLIDADAAQFDRTYMNAQVQMHQNLLQQLDASLIPNAQNAELKTFLQDVRSAAAAHLKKAQEIQAKL